ncbi:DUF2793 domain-containing protein [Sphingobium subterraneum]|uniref:DUF2793 domain-containing protein n=1 Tax=Sphingobium subterraneum TaxID=627688 RepID=A0A841J2U2_9SPHN|nr:DUF2793 domain-containing protein [Sphingobium subterraneum]MBB6125137.1 hypothetical protein [Sphingobium subterraneum]
MAEDTTDRLGLPLLHAAQAQKEIFHNEALLALDRLVHARMESATVATPPTSPAPGQSWIVPPSGATGAWAGQGNRIASWSVSGWRFTLPVAGMEFTVADEGQARRWSGTDWVLGPVRADGFYQGGNRVVGAQQAGISAPAGGAVIDAEARLTLNAVLGVLRNHGLIAL